MNSLELICELLSTVTQIKWLFLGCAPECPSILNLFCLMVFWISEMNLQIYIRFEMSLSVSVGESRYWRSWEFNFIDLETTLVLSELKPATNRTTCHLNSSVCAFPLLTLCHLKPCDDRVNHSTIPLLYNVGFVTCHFSVTFLDCYQTFKIYFIVFILKFSILSSCQSNFL